MGYLSLFPNINKFCSNNKEKHRENIGSISWSVPYEGFGNMLFETWADTQVKEIKWIITTEAKNKSITENMASCSRIFFSFCFSIHNMKENGYGLLYEPCQFQLLDQGSNRSFNSLTSYKWSLWWKKKCNDCVTLSVSKCLTFLKANWEVHCYNQASMANEILVQRIEFSIILLNGCWHFAVGLDIRNSPFFSSSYDNLSDWA